MRTHLPPRPLLLPLLALLPLLLSSCVTRAELSRMVQESRPCEAGEACVLAGGSQCTCASAVNAKHQQAIDDAAGRVLCEGAVVECAGCPDPQCVEGQCTCQ